MRAYIVSNPMVLVRCEIDGIVGVLSLLLDCISQGQPKEYPAFRPGSLGVLKIREANSTKVRSGKVWSSGFLASSSEAARFRV